MFRTQARSIWAKATLLSVASLLAVATFAQQPTEDLGWPKEIDVPEGKIIIYQPQPETLTGHTLKGRAAMALERKGSEPVFGVFWLTGILQTDTDAGTAVLHDIKVTKVGWKDSTAENEARFTRAVEAAIPAAGYTISMERLSASLKAAQREQQSMAELKNDPPKIVFATELSVLLMFDGAPKFQAIPNTKYERAMNTPFAVARGIDSKIVYVTSGKHWYMAKDPMGPYEPIVAPPQDLAALVPKAQSAEAAPAIPPKIVVATVPTELISTQGPPQWKSLTGGELMYVSNTESPWLRDIAGNQMYVLLSGRWFRAATQSGPWSFVRADRLPASFKNIPPDSDIGGLRVSVAGTEEAEDAVLDAQIPQTAAIKRSEAKLEVKYDGAPKFEKIPNTKVSYAVNTPAQVLQIESMYYAVDNGVWFVSKSATGPWAVADKIPQQEIDKIPPSSPVYNVTYCEVYDSTPEVVYVGYTPGYMWSFPYYGVPVYGTGWYYPPYVYGPIYYPRPPTWGFHVGYNPWTGWNFGLSWSNGFFSFGIAWSGGPHATPYGGGWYGGGYRGPVNINTGDINIGNNVNIGNRDKVSHNMADRGGNANRVSNNMYNRPETRSRQTQATQARANTNQARVASGRENNVYADANGNVARRTGDSWETRSQGQWQSQADRPSASTGASTRQSSSQFDRASADRAYQSRSSGAMRESRSMPMRSGGGGRRR